MSTRPIRRFADLFRQHVGLAHGRDNGTRRIAPRALSIGCALLGSALGACSLSLPITNLKSDEVATNSIDRTAGLLSPGFAPEDWRRARAALAVTLDPQGNGTRAAWRSPQSGAHGTFTAVGPPFPDQNRVCRKFVGEVVTGGTAASSVAGSACRDGAGDWALRGEVVPRAS